MRKIYVSGVLAFVCLGVSGLGVSSVSAMKIDEMVVVAASEITPATAASQDLPMGQSGEGGESLLPEDAEFDEDSDLFGGKGGYFHPYLSIEGQYTDNVYNAADNELSSFITRISPGIWFSLPRTREIPIQINPSNSAPGGLAQQVKDYEGTDRYQSYALAGLDYRAYSEDSDLNDTDFHLEGMFRYNMKGGLSLQVLDGFNYAQDMFEYGASTRDNLRRYKSNVFIATADYLFREKLRAKLDYSNFMLDYEDAVNDFLDRSDNAIDLYGYYLFSPKTSFFLQYRYVDVSYDSQDQKDNTQNYFYGGVTWDTTEKFSVLFKVGYQDRSYEDDLISEGYDWDGLTFDLQTLYRWTEKTKFTLDGYRKSEESDSAVAIDKEVLGLRFGYEQQYTEKLSGLLRVTYENADYTQLDGATRDDDRYYLRPSLQYLFKKWLMVELAYMFDKRESTDELFDYTTNSFMLNLNMSM